MNTGIIKYFKAGGTFPLLAVVTTVFFIILITLGVLAYFDKKEGHREKFIKSIIILIVSAFVISSAYAISMTFHKVIEEQATIGNVSIGEALQTTIGEFGKAVGFWERALYSFLDIFAESAIWIRDFIIGQNVGIRQILNKCASNPIVSFNVEYGDDSVNLYNLILISASFLLFIMVVNSGYKLAKFSYNTNSREEVIKSFTKWFYVLLLIMIIPATFITATKVMDIAMNILNKINDSYVISTDTLTVEAYGPLAPIAKIYISYLEFKVYVLMLYRKFIINAFYITIPITVYLWGISDNFESLTLWTNTLLMNIFSPIFYSISFVIGSLVLRSLENGENPIIMIIISSLCLKVGDELKKIVKYKNNASVLGGSTDVSGISRTIFTGAMIARTLHSIASKKTSISNSSNTAASTIKTANNAANNANFKSNASTSSTVNDTNMLGKSKSNENTYKSKGNGLGLNYTMGNAIKDSVKLAKSMGINSNSMRKGVKVVAGVAAGISTANPLLGYAAYKGSGAVLNGVGKATSGVLNTARNIKGGANKVGSYFKGNSDVKAHRRD
ncbi:hypothetical protein JYG23_12360 [Sedimentibacter sp. zth1]|uniref:hypothetical protein n=1 Tax=Sedimentibacter sp. zth1 TaxID=2816908 RepID=UPI001A9353B8|nr:hypothetical protein [Sedimentibacter sp. zth1]QSX05461.1 hypothetical protein JYG23_12360 [Sedimentibacter sp. zth1]